MVQSIDIAGIKTGKGGAAMRLLCYGDSNTYGCDPRSPRGGRYPIQVPWTGRLTEQGYQVEN